MRSFEAKEQEDGVENEGRCDAAQGVHEQVQFRLFESVLGEPFEDFVFSHQVTSVDGRETASEVHHCWKFGDAVLPCVTGVADLDERDVQVVRLGVDVLQFLEDFLTLWTVVLIWKRKSRIRFIPESKTNT